MTSTAYTRCRTLAQRKDGATWDSITQEERDAWLKGTTADLTEAGLL